LPPQFGDCLAHNNSPDANYLYSDALNDKTGEMGVVQAIALKPVNCPPYNFIFIDACFTAQNDGMAKAFGITDGFVDKAYFGYTGQVDDSKHNTDWSDHFFTDLRTGMSVGAAQTETNTNFGFPTLGIQNAPTSILGDTGTKIHGVYGGTDLLWFK